MGDDIRETLTDEAFCRLATQLPVARHVVRLEADITFFGVKILTAYSGSAVCIGDGTEFITSAHCIAPWLDYDGKIKHPIYISGEGLTRKKIIDCQVHEKYNHEYTENIDPHDIAYLCIQDPIKGLQGIEPTYTQPTCLENQSLNIVGYGASGDTRSWLSRLDGKKRAVKSFINYVSKNDQPILSKIVVKYRQLNDYEGAFRPGMSGGGGFLNGQYIAIPTWTKIHRRTCLGIDLRCYLRNKLKYLAAVGIPVPFMVPRAGDTNKYIPLSIHQTWIEAARQKRKSLNPK
ncbi:MAG: serine protease [Alphaproteobacteria bacterium]|nr:serine protease [Alphaproteobacteria bacterium]